MSTAPAARATDPTRTPPAGRCRRRRVRRTLALVAVGLLVASHWVVEPVRVTSGSMSPTLTSGDHVLLLRTPWSGAVARGDVVVIGPDWPSHPAAPAPVDPENLGRAQDGSSYVKRVVATAGDVVGLEDGQLVVNGAKPVEPWVDSESMDGVWFGPVTVPPGAVFVLGDDRSRSVDSRDLGPVRLDDLDGRVVTPWPLG